MDSRGLLSQKQMNILNKVKDQASEQEERMHRFAQELSEAGKFNAKTIDDTANVTAEKVSKIMETYLGDDPDTQEALEFLCLVVGAEVTHYNVLSAVAKEVEEKY